MSAGRPGTDAAAGAGAAAPGGASVPTPAAGLGGDGGDSHLLVLVSHRGPVSFTVDEQGRAVGKRGSGGLVTALSGLAGHVEDAVWICAADSAEDRRLAAGGPVDVVFGATPTLADADAKRTGAPVLTLRYLDIPPEEHAAFYARIANPLLWFLQHGLYGLAREPVLDDELHRAFDEGYVRANQRMADAVVQEVQARAGEAGAATVMIHDYHFYLVAGRVREHCPNVLLSHFVHIPWPGPDTWRILSPAMREQLLRGLLGNDVVAFHTERSARNFLLCAQELLGLPVDLDQLTVLFDGRRVAARYYPISIDPRVLDELAASDEVAHKAAGLRALLRASDRLVAPQEREGEAGPAPRQLILRVDRTDPSKNILRGFQAYDLLLSKHPEWRERVVFFALLQPSRLDVPDYAQYLSDIGGVVAQVNARHGTPGWQPIELRFVSDLPLAVAAYTMFDVLLVNSIADGMNLVAKEAVLVNQSAGVLALSENTGAYAELSAFAVRLAPFDVVQQAEALHEALCMPVERRRELREAAARVVRSNDIEKWLAVQVSDLQQLRAEQQGETSDDAPRPMPSTLVAR